MSHLPPRPDFSSEPSPPRRQESRGHYYSARPQPMAPDRVYPHPPPRERERERDVYIARSPPRARHPPPRLADSYVAGDRERDREYRDPYYDRHRDAYREREWRERERERDYFPPPPPPPPHEYRYREESRAWTPRDRRDVRDSRPWTQSSEIDRHPKGSRYRDFVEGDRRWDTRPGRSPPRSHAYPPRPESSSSRARSPRRRTPSPEPRRSSPFSPRRRSLRSPPRTTMDTRPLRRSRSPTPRRGDISSPRYRSRDSPTRSTRRSPSPRREPPLRTSVRGRSRSPRAQSPHSRRSRSRSGSPRRVLHRLPPSRQDTGVSPTRNEPKPDAKPSITRRSPSPMQQDPPLKAKSPPTVSQPPPKDDSTAKSPSVQPPADEVRDSPSLPSLPQVRGIVKSPATPISPQGRSPLPGPADKPASTPGTMPEATASSGGLAPIPDYPPGEFALVLKRIFDPQNESEKKEIEYKPDPVMRDLNVQLSMLSAHQAHLETAYYTTAKDARKALQELRVSHIELATAEEKRKLADAQLELAMAGLIGIDFKPGNPHTAKWESLEAQAAPT